MVDGALKLDVVDCKMDAIGIDVQAVLEVTSVVLPLHPILTHGHVGRYRHRGDQVRTPFSINGSGQKLTFC